MLHLGLLLVGDALGVLAGVAAGVPLGLLGTPGLEADALLSSAFAEVLQRQCKTVLKHSALTVTVQHMLLLRCEHLIRRPLGHKVFFPEQLHARPACIQICRNGAHLSQKHAAQEPSV